ncbi:MAG TPA: GNAT family N-acetyltransferase [Acidimicrobiia bacterium]|nr:GNAT family N-acetyltransferase [Acidimicrobiia bacterium]
MSIDLRVAHTDELERFARLREQGYAIPVNQRSGWIERVSTTGRTERLVGAFDGDRLVGMLNVLAFEQWFGGRAVPMGGVASVVVAPEERGRGIAPRMLAFALTLMAERGEVVSTLGPATTWAYRKCGWELAGHYGVVSVRTADLVGLAEGSTRERRATTADRDGMIAAYDRAAPSHPGFLARPTWLWDERLEDAPNRFTYVVERDARIEGYVTYNESAVPRGINVWVDDLVGTDADAQRTLWRHLGAHLAQAEHVTVAGVPLDALEHLLPEQRIKPLGQQVWMTRILDVVGAIAARGFAPAARADVSFRLRDPFAPGNEGSWRLIVEDGRGRIEPAATEPDAVLTVNGLGALYTGWSSSAVLLDSGMAQGLSAAEAITLDAVFSGRRPVMSDDF